MAVFFKQEAAAEKRLEISGMPGRDREEEESCREKEKNEEEFSTGADCPVEGKERFVIAEMDPNRYVPLPEMMVDFDDAACRIS